MIRISKINFALLFVSFALCFSWRSLAATLRVTTTFPSPLVFHHIKDWQGFESVFVNACAIKLLSARGGRLTPDLAESWEVSKDGKEYVFKIRRNAMFSDGSPLEASAAAFAIERHIKLGGQNAEELKNTIKGALNSGKGIKVSGIEILDPTQLKITLVRKHDDFLTLISMLSFSIFKPVDLNLLKDEIKSNFVASGPYKVRTVSERKIVLDKNEKYWNEELLSKIPESVELIDSKDLSINTIASGVSDVAAIAGSGVNKELLAKSGIQFVRAGLGQNYLLPDFKGRTLAKVPDLVRSIHILLDRQKIIENQKSKGFFDSKGIVALTAGIESIETEFNQKHKGSLKVKDKVVKKLTSQVEIMRKSSLSLTIAFKDSTPYARAFGESVASEIESLGIPVSRLPLDPSEINSNQNSGKFDLRIVGEMWDITKPALA